VDPEFSTTQLPADPQTAQRPASPSTPACLPSLCRQRTAEAKTNRTVPDLAAIHPEIR